MEERGLSLSCPVAAEMIVNNSILELLQEVNDLFPDINDIDADLYLSLASARNKIFSYISSDKVTVEMLFNLLSYGKAIQSLAEKEMYEQISLLEISNCEKLNFTIDFDSLFSSFEYLTQEGKTLFSSFNSNIEISNDKLNTILNYYIYRYFLKSVYDMNIFAYVAFSVLSVLSIAYVGKQTQSNITHIAQIYSKEIEHSKDNFNSIIEYFNR